MAIRFTKSYTPKAAGEKAFKEGDEVDFYELYAEDEAVGANPDEAERQRRARATASEEHFVRRGVAERIEEDEPKTRRGVKSAPAPKGEGKEAGGDGEADDLEGKTVAELHEIAAAENVEGRAGLNKAELTRAIRKTRRAAEKK